MSKNDVPDCVWAGKCFCKCEWCKRDDHFSCTDMHIAGMLSGNCHKNCDRV